jgi:ubiquitin-conjugating enzyme E2 S
LKLPHKPAVSDIRHLLEDTPFAGGQFRIKLVIGSDFPSVPPKGYFLTKIFHPNISAGGEICVNTLKKDWKPDLSIKEVLVTIRCLLIIPFPESALNEEAGKLFMERYEDYFKHAKLMTSIHAMPKTSSSKTNEGQENGESGNISTKSGEKAGGEKEKEKSTKKDSKKRSSLKRL